MSLPSQEILDDIKDLITEITGFQENDENFAICERYCLSHVVHHTYPFVNRTTVRNLINSYVSRFYAHGYFAVSRELNNQTECFLSNTKLFEKNPQYDIQWCLLSLLSSLSSNLTTIKHIPELLSIDNEESEKDDFEWREYLLSDLLQQNSQNPNSDNDDSMYSDSTEKEEEEEEKEEKKEINENSIENSAQNPLTEKDCGKSKEMEILFDNRIAFSEDTTEYRRKKIQQILNIKKEERDVKNDYLLRKNIAEEFDNLLIKKGITRKSQLISEFELMEYILYQFQTGDRILFQKGFTTPSLTSLTQETLGSYLDSLQPYFKIIRCFNEFDEEVTDGRYSHEKEDLELLMNENSELSKSQVLPIGKSPEKRKIPNVLYTYNMMLKRAIEPFQNEVREIADNLNNFTLLQLENKLKPYYFDLTSLFYVHNLATKNWKTDKNYVSSIRILSVLYNAIVNATSIKMSFLYLNLFLHCFQVYLEFIDSWILFVKLIDPFEEFVVVKSSGDEKSVSKCCEYEIRPYKNEIDDFGQFKIIDFISEKMIHVGQSLEVLKRLNRFVTKETPEQSSFHLLLNSIDVTVRSLERSEPEEKKRKRKEKKKKSVFTIKDSFTGLNRDNGGGDFLTDDILKEILMENDEKKEEAKKTEETKPLEKIRKSESYCEEMINSVVRNSFFKMAFDNIGMKQVESKLAEAKKRVYGDELMLIRQPKEENKGVYPLHKIITESVQLIIGNRVSGACSLVKDIVVKECKLFTHLSLFRSVFLFGDSFLIQPFILAVFTQPVMWTSSYSLSLHLKECVRNFYKDFANDLSVTLTKTNSKCENVLQVIDLITVMYEVKWPLTLILTKEAIRKYNEIFRLALKLKWAHWALCSVHFSEGGECLSKSILHRLRLLRFWLLSAFGRIHNYFLAQMIPFDLKLDSCEDLKDIINGHFEFLEKLHHNCLLGEKSPEGRKLILNTLVPLCMELLSEGEKINERKLSAIEETFGNCYIQLTSLLSSLEK